jgi:hypothetical protein
VFGSFGTVLSAQALEIKLIDGRNGHPVADACVNVWVGNEHKDALVVPTDRTGVAHLRLTNQDDEVDTQNRSKACGGFGVINPVMKYSASVRVNVGYVWCRPRGTDSSWLAIEDFPTEQLVRQGVVSANTCDKLVASPRPGERIIFVRPLNFWEKFKQ